MDDIGGFPFPRSAFNEDTIAITDGQGRFARGRSTDGK
jgi:hypothetical protein